MNGVVNFLKPAMMSSHDAVNMFRSLTGIKKIGHTGTLDPMATGVLPICIGKATRLIEYAEGNKAYRAIMKLGIESDTGDIWGSTTAASPLPAPAPAPPVGTVIDEFPSLEMIEDAFRSIEGRNMQQIPAFSAKKHNGKRLYEYAREGLEIQNIRKEVYINKATVISCNEAENEIVFDIECSKGTYIRAICTDIGEKLGTKAVMSFLLRTRTDDLKIGDSVTVEEMTDEIKINDSITRFVNKPEILLGNLKDIVLNSKEGKMFINGVKIEKELGGGTQIYAVYTGENENERTLLGIGSTINNTLKPEKVIYEERLP